MELPLRYTTPDIHCRHRRYECDGGIRVNRRTAGQEVDQKEDLGEVVQKDCQTRKLNEEDAMGRSRWEKLIKVG